FGQLGFDEQSDGGFLGFAAVRPGVRKKQRAGELLGQRARAFDGGAFADIVINGAGDADRVDAGMQVKAPILDRNDGVLEVGRDLGEAYVVSLLVKAKPRAAVRAIKDRVADTP